MCVIVLIEIGFAEEKATLLGRIGRHDQVTLRLLCALNEIVSGAGNLCVGAEESATG